MPNTTELHGIGNAINSKHDVVLQRLDTLMKNNGKQILYSTDAFRDVDKWISRPVIYADAEIGPVRHPTNDEVNGGNLPPGMSVQGRITSAYLGTGEPTLRGKIEIDDPALDAQTSAGEMSLSTGFSATIENIEGQDQITGSVVPNHVLMFRRGACPNCYPNDNSARFENLKTETIMDDEAKGLFKKFTEAIENLRPSAAVKEEIEDTKMIDNTEAMKNITDENAALKAKLESMENAAEQKKKDGAWAEMKNVVPAGWLGDKEPETRAEFENNTPAFAVKLMKFTVENKVGEKNAEGSQIGDKKELTNAVEVEMNNINADLAKKYGFMITGGDE